MARRRSLEVIQTAQFVSIGELVRLTGVRYSTLKFYTEEGLLPFEQAEERLTRRYDRESTVERLALIRRLKAEGHTITAVKAILSRLVVVGGGL
jgi:DNA-binding transcriptional MerR regulator